MITNRTLTLDDILSADDREIHCEDVPEWGGRVWVRGLTGDARDELEQEVADMGGNHVGLRARIVARGLCSENGESFDLSEKQIHELGQKSAAVLDRLSDRIQDLSGLSKRDVEKLEGNSETTANDGTG